MKLREGQAEVNEAAAREVELFCQLEQERHNARLAVEAQKESEEALRQLQAMVKVLEEERGRDDDTRRTWAEERRKWAEGVEAVRVAAAQKHDELYATLQSCRRQLENAQLEAAKSEARAVAADDRAAAAEGAREVSDSVWQEKLAAAHAEAQLRGQELTARDEALRGHERERSLWKTGVAELEMRTAQLTEELQQRGEAARGLMAEAASLRLELVSRDAAVASQEDEMESLAEEVLTLKEERDRAVGELEATTTACMELEAEMLQGQREAASVHEQRFAEQEARWLAQAASWELGVGAWVETVRPTKIGFEQFRFQVRADTCSSLDEPAGLHILRLRAAASFSSGRFSPHRSLMRCLLRRRWMPRRQCLPRR